MSKLYVFGIGGTGSRVIKAMTMMFATGVKLPNNFDVVVPIIIDPDSSNEDLTQAKEVLKCYRSIRSKIQNPNDFYQQDIQSVDDLLGNTGNQGNAFCIPISGTTQNTFGQYVGVNSMNFNALAGTDDQNLVKLLYSQANLNSNLNVGFKGSPNMGSVVLSQIIQSQGFNDFCQTFSQGDAVFIINSIFGGTGAAGFPLLVKNLRSNTNIPRAAFINNCEIGDITYLPYFSLQQPAGGFQTVNPNTFDEKAKVAINYYNQTIIGGNQVNAIYFAGYQGNRGIEKYCEGGTGQRNKAHFLELAGALAIYNFCGNYPLKNPNTNVMEFGVASNNIGNGITLDDLDPKDENLLLAPMVKFRLFTQYLQKCLPKALKCCRWTTDNIKLVPNHQKSILTQDFFGSAEYTGLVKKMNDMFDAWISEMEQNSPSFCPFNSVNPDDLLAIRKNKAPKHKKSCKGIDVENDRLITKKDFRGNEITLLFKMFAESIEKNCKINQII